MRSCCVFLLVYLLGNSFGGSSSQRNTSCTTDEACGQMADPTQSFLQCVGLPSTDTGTDHLRRLKVILEATMDIYTFMRSSLNDVPLMILQGELLLNPTVDPLQNEALIQMWMEVKLKPLLKSVTKDFLSCLSTKNFSCSTYQTMVKELSHHYSEMSPVRQKWIYTFFMYPFLSGDRVSGCMNSSESSEDWLLKNFGAFRVLARMTNFSALNMVFSGLEVLHLLSPAQKAELLLKPEITRLDNTTIELIFHSMVTGSPGHLPMGPNWSNNWTSPGHPTSFPTFSPHPTYDLYRPSPQISVKGVLNGFMTAFKPIRSFVHDFVSLTKVRGVSEMKSTTLTQFLLNWTLAELADSFRPRNLSLVPEMPEFDVTNMEDWYQHVVMPVLKRFLPHRDPMHQNITFAFQQLFFLDQNKDNETTVILDVCSLTLDGNPCALTDVVENVAHVLRCAAQTDLKLTEEPLMRLVIELTKRLNVLIGKLSKMDLKEVADELEQILTETEPPSLTLEHLEDPDFILKWFKVKLLPLLPAVPPQLLSCLSTKNFSCPVYQTIVRALSTYMDKANDNPIHSQVIYKNFIFPFLLHHNTSDRQCVAGNNSTQWLKDNFAYFSKFAFITDFYELHPQFSGVEVIQILSPKQLAELILRPLPTPPKKEEVIDAVFHYLVGTMEPKSFTEVLEIMVQLAKEVSPTCNVFKHIFTRLYHAVPNVPPDTEPLIWTTIDDLMSIALEDCLPDNLTCPVIQINGSNICQKTSSMDLEYHVNTFLPSSCNYTLEKYACAQLENFTASQLSSALMCDLPGNTSRSKVLWKMLLTKHSDILNPALDNLANMSMTAVAPSATDILDVIGEMRVSMLTNEQLMNSSVIQLWFSSRLSSFLPFASGRFLHCLSNRNISCQSYQQILHGFVHHFENMTLQQQQLVLKNFILRVLRQQPSGCVFATNSSAQWLKSNFGPFLMLMRMEQLLHINPNFNPVEVLQILTPKQIAELLVLNIRPQDVLINLLFDHLNKSDQQKNLPEFLSHLFMLIPQANLSCSSFKTLFTRLDTALATFSWDIASAITQNKMDLSMYIPSGCIIYSGECDITMTNETDICVGVNSTEFQLNLDSNTTSERFCNFTVEEYACASLTYLSADDLAAVLKCNRSSDPSSSRPVWKLLLSKASPVLDQALDLLSNMTLNPRNPALSMILDSVREIRLDNLGNAHLNNPTIIQSWFHRLQPLLPAVSTHFLSCLTSKGLSCSTYQHIVQSLSGVQPHMTHTQQMSVYTHFIKAFLTRNDSADPFCSLRNNHSGQWLQLNLGTFSGLLSFHEIQMLYSNFSAMEALPQLTVKQLAEVSATPGLLVSSRQATMVMNHVRSKQLPIFFDHFSPAIMDQENFPSAVRSAILQVVFDRGNLSDHSVSDSIVMLWLHNRLRPLLVNLSALHVAPFFNILRTRSCEVEQMGVESLNQTSSTLHEDTRNRIHDHIIRSLKGPTPLRCYNGSHSFYTFVLNSFLGFQVPNLTSFLSLMPHNRTHLLVNSMPPSHLGDYLRLPDVVDSNDGLCLLLRNYNQITTFLATEQVVQSLRHQVLLCVWAHSLTISSRPEVDAIFSGLEKYMLYLTKGLISPNFTHNASCIAFQKLVSVLGEHNYTATDFERPDVFISIKDYLTSETMPRCYNRSNPELNSTAWFAEYIGPFMPFLTLEDLQTFGSDKVIQKFTVDPLNIALLNHSVLPINLTNYYTELVYQQDENFNPLLLPLLCRCVAPGLAFAQLTAEESRIVLWNLTKICTDLDPQVSAALASNLGDTITSSDISALGSKVTSLSTNQLRTLSPMLIMSYLSTFSGACDWRHSQARIIILTLHSSRVMQMNSAASLLSLDCLLMGFPSQLFLDINGSQLITASKNPSLVQNLLTAPTSNQDRFVSQIISHNNNNEVILQNVPDELATSIPRALLVGFSNKNTVIKGLNRKKWKRQQAVIFFSVIANENSTSELGGANNLSSPVLQGFTCIGVRSIQKVHIKSLVKACRRKGKNRVKLVETQLTCMYNHIKGDSDVTNIELYPPDLLLYYDYSLVPQDSCRSYFEQLGDADFSLFSPTLSYKRVGLIQNAMVCLGITNTSLTEDDISVLGNMCCFFDANYIQTSDPIILEKLKNCEDITEDQTTAVENLLMTGPTPYGNVSQWTSDTLEKLGMLPLYFTSEFYAHINRREKRTFLRNIRKVLKRNGVGRQKRRKWMKEIRKSVTQKSKRSVDARCEVGEITSVTVSDESFPFDYSDISQFEFCLMPTFVKGHLDSIIEKLVEDDYLKIVLNKLKEAYSNSSSIPENEVQRFGPMSRVATVEDIRAWTITELDTLGFLMVSSDGPWNLTVAEAVVLKYLSVEGNKLGTLELNIIPGDILCSLGTDVLMNISYQSLREADPPDVSSCSLEKKKSLFHIIRQESTNTRSAAAVSADEYQLSQPYLGGADSAYIQSLAQSDVNMDMPTFTSLDEAVVLNLSVSNVKDLLGTNLAELKSYENNSLVQNWTSTQPQSELDTLGVGLTGGRADTTASSSSPNTAVTVTPGAATNATSNPTNATGVTFNPTNATGVSSNPTNATGVSSNPTNATGVSSNPTNATAVTSNPTNTTGVTSNPTNATGVTSNSTIATNPSNSSTAVPGPSSGGSTSGSNTAAATTTSATTTKGHAARIRSDAGFSFLVMLTLLSLM